MLIIFLLQVANKTRSGFIAFYKFDKKAAKNCGINKVNLS
jgi:hypothetical protein